MLQLSILVLVFAGTAGIIYGGFIFFNRRAVEVSDAALDRLREIEQAALSARKILREETVSDLPLLDKLLSGREWTARLSERLRRSGSKMSPGSFVLRAGIGVAAGLILGGVIADGVFLPIVFAASGGLIAVTWLSIRVRNRARLFKEQLPDAIDMLVSAMKAGYSLQVAMKFIGEEMTPPLGPEFLRVYDEQRLGMDVRTALLAMDHRMDDLDLRMFVTAVLIQRETGGNLSEVLERIATLMRERAALKGEIATLTAESKLSGRVVASLPLVVFGGIQLIDPNFTRPLLDSAMGPWVLGGAGVSVLFGYWLMMKVTDIDI